MAGPNIPSGQQRNTLVYLIDIFPTLCKLLELPIPKTVEGINLCPIFNNPREKVRDYLHFAFEEVQRGIRNQEYKLIEYIVDGHHRETQLFNMIHDPREMKNLVNDETYSDILKTLRNELKKWQTTYGDTREQGLTFWSAYPH